jgi:DNA-binding NarL/FixJ family response regulator
VRIARRSVAPENDLVNANLAGSETRFMISSTDVRIPTRVFLVDDQAMLRASFKSLLARDPRFQVVGDTGDSRLAAARVAETLPDVVLLDISMPGLSGIDAIPLIKHAHPRVKIVMLTHHEGELFVQQALSAGADGYLSKDSDPAELALALEAAMQGHMFLSPRVTSGLMPRGTMRAQEGNAARSRIGSLTAREREVLQLLAQGRTNKEIATTLQITLGTTKKHRENLQRKLDCHGTAELALLAVKEGLIEA